MKKTRGKPKKARLLDQIGALPLRTVGGHLEVLLVTSRETGKWVIPKGWPMHKRKKWQAAAIEAQEEGGVVGDVGHSPVGTYRYWKRLEKRFELCRVVVYPLVVLKAEDDWKERGERQVRWLDPLNAADTALEPELSSLILKAARDERVTEFVRKRERKNQ